jgi:hypothetical protein
MTTQPTALRLADALEISSNHGMRREAAAELRRLHAENERWRAAAAMSFDALALDAGPEQVQREADALRELGSLLRA